MSSSTMPYLTTQVFGSKSLNLAIMNHRQDDMWLSMTTVKNILMRPCTPEVKLKNSVIFFICLESLSSLAVRNSLIILTIRQSLGSLASLMILTFLGETELLLLSIGMRSINWTGIEHVKSIQNHICIYILAMYLCLYSIRPPLFGTAVKNVRMMSVKKHRSIDVSIQRVTVLEVSQNDTRIGT